MSANSTDDKIGASNMLTSALWKIFALAESYPDLKANESFIKLQSELSDIENKLAAARRFFNSATTEFNTYIELFPTSIIAWIFNFKRAELFEIENRKVVWEVPKVAF
jgi:LemA protein